MSPQAPNDVRVKPGEVTSPAPAPLRDVDLLAAEIFAARERRLDAAIGPASKREIMWFGDIHSCDRHNYYSMAEGDQRIKWTSHVQAKMDAGLAREQINKRILSELGYEPLLAGEVVELKDKQGRVIARGKTDLSLRFGRKTYPVEMKCMQPMMWERIVTWKDLLRNHWTEKYLRQLMLYMLGKDIDQGLFLLDDFQGHWKFIPVYLDYDFCENTLRKVERAIEAAKTKTPPDRIPYSTSLCGRCAFANVCIPDIKDAGLKDLNNTELPALLERRDQLKEKASEYAKIEKAVRALFENIKDGVFTVGNFIVTRKGSETTKYDIPEDVKAKYAVKVEQFRNKIERFLKPDPDTIYLEPKRGFSFDDDE